MKLKNKVRILDVGHFDYEMKEVFYAYQVFPIGFVQWTTVL